MTEEYVADYYLQLHDEYLAQIEALKELSETRERIKQERQKELDKKKKQLEKHEKVKA